jgi:CDP-diacylglycerol--glycerol-3-phosphate 3-phosphatidyltransferase
MTTQGANQTPKHTTLTDYLRANTRFIIDPIVVVMDRIGLTPNTLTVLGVLVHFGFAYLIIIGQFQWAAIATFLLGPLDAFDGALSRYQGRVQGGFGAFLDSTLDRISEIILFGGFMLYFSQGGNALWLGFTYAAIAGSLMVSYARGRAEALGYDCKVGFFTRIERYGFICLGLVFNLPQAAVAVLAVGTWFTVGQRALHVWRQAQAD